MTFKKMENIGYFIKSCRTSFGMPEHDLFNTIDLSEEKDLGSVNKTIIALGRKAKLISSYKGPQLEIKVSCTIDVIYHLSVVLYY